MANRFAKVFSLKNDLYAKGSPLIICAGALLLDDETKNAIVQLKFKNITNDIVRMVKIQITQKDSANRILGDPFEFEYLDLNEERDSEFGSKIPVVLPNNNARSYSVQIIEVIFASNHIWTNDNSEWESIPGQKELLPADNELKKQFASEICSKAQYEMLEEKDLWLCSCGAINKENENFCHICSTEYDKLKNVDMEALEAHKVERLEQEAQEKEEERKRLEEKREENKKKAKKYAPYACVVAVVLIALLIVNFKVLKPSREYKAAVASMEEGKLNDALTMFEALGNYKDAENMILECKYRIATEEMNTEKFEDGLNHFSELGDYKDSADQFGFYESYTEAIQDVFDMDGNYAIAMDFFENHPNFINSAGWVHLTNATKYYYEKEYKKAYDEICQIDGDFCCNEFSTQAYDSTFSSIVSMYAFKSERFSVKEACDLLSTVNTDYADVSYPLKTLQPMADCDGTFSCTDDNNEKFEVTITHWMHNGGKYSLEIQTNYEGLEFKNEPLVLIDNKEGYDYKVEVAGKLNGKDQVFYIYYSPSMLLMDGGFEGETRYDHDNNRYTNGSYFGSYIFGR